MANKDKYQILVGKRIKATVEDGSEIPEAEIQSVTKNKLAGDFTIKTSEFEFVVQESGMESLLETGVSETQTDKVYIPELMIEKIYENKENGIKYRVRDGKLQMNDTVSGDFEDVYFEDKEEFEYVKDRLAESGLLIDESFLITRPNSKNNPDYKYYAINQDNRIIQGFEYKEDVRKFVNSQADLGHDIRLVSKRDLPVDANEDSNWGDIDKTKSVIETLEKALEIDDHNFREVYEGCKGIIKSSPPEDHNKAMQSRLAVIKSGKSITQIDKDILKDAIYGVNDYLLDNIGKSRRYKVYYSSDIQDFYNQIPQLENFIKNYPTV